MTFLVWHPTDYITARGYFSLMKLNKFRIKYICIQLGFDNGVERDMGHAVFRF